MVLCDTNIFISAFNGRQDTINQLNTIGLKNVVLSAISVMELYQGMSNKAELAQMKKRIAFYDVIQVENGISERAIELMDEFKLSHGLTIPDAIIGATALVHKMELYTYNLRDFDFLPDIQLYQIR